MKKLILFLFAFLFANYAFAGPWPCDYSGANTMNCYASKEATASKEFLNAIALDMGATVSTKFTLDSNGNITKLNNVVTTFPATQGAANAALANDGSGGLTWSTAFLLNPMTTTGDIIYSSNNSGSPARLAIGGANTVVHGGTIPAYSAVALTADVTGVLPTANGGTGQNSTATFPTSGTVLTDTNTVSPVTNKTLNNTNAATLKDGSFTLQSTGDVTKQAVFSLTGISSGTTKTYTLPNNSSTLVDLSASQSLTNKTLNTTNTVTLTDSLFELKNSSSLLKTLDFDLSGSAVATPTILATASSASRTITLPDATTTLVGTDATQSLTNKSIDATEINSGLLSRTNGGTGVSSTATFPSSGVVVTEAATETLTSKTLSGNTATNLINGSGTTNFPSSGTITIPAATDTLVGKATTDVLTNKTLNGNTATNLISGAGTITHNTSGTITVPNATDTLVGKATTDTLTNKSIAASEVNSGTLAVAQGGTNLASGTSGGVLGYTASGTLASSAALTANGIVLGGGAGATPTSTGACTTTTQVLHGGSPPSCSAIVSADLPAITQSAKGVDASAGQRLGTNTNDTATAGNIGEQFQQSRLRSAALSAPTTGTNYNVLSSPLSLTAGAWRIDAMECNAPSGNWTMLQAAISLTSATLPGTDTRGVEDNTGQIETQISIPSGTSTNDICLYTSTYIVLASTTNIYLVAVGTFTSGSNSVWGQLFANRTR